MESQAEGALLAFVRVIEWISKAFGILAVFLLLLGVVVVCHLVWVRYVLEDSAIWQHEFTTYALIAGTFLGSPYVLMVHGHVNVDLLPHYLPMPARRFMAIIAALIGLAFCGYLTWTGWWFFHEAWVDGRRAGTVWNPPLWIPYLTLPVGMGLICLQYVAQILGLMLGRVRPFGIEKEEEA